MAGLNRDILRLNRTLRLGPGRTGQENHKAGEIRIPASALPSWLETGAKCCYVSKTRGDTHSVKVLKIDSKQQTVTIVFEQDRRTWKKVPFSECAKTGDGTLRPVWKAPEQVATCSGPPSQSSAPAGSPGTALGQPRRTQAVEDIASSDEGEVAPVLLDAAVPPLQAKGPAASSLLVPRTVVLAKTRKAAASQSSAVSVHNAAGHRRSLRPPDAPAEVSDDDVVEYQGKRKRV